MSDVVCVTQRQLCAEPFLTRIEKISASRPAAVLLREKDLFLEDYIALAAQVEKICMRHGVALILHSFPEAARRLSIKKIHLPIPLLRKLSEEEKNFFQVLGASCHSVDEAKEAEQLGCSYLTFGHIFETNCKKGLPGRGLDLLKEVCQSVQIPVVAIGGITPENVQFVRQSGAKGICVMSSLMTCDDVGTLMHRLSERE